MHLLLLPNQLFHIKYLPPDITNIILYEHPDFFTKYNFNKKKLILHGASLQCYQDYLLDNGYKVKYLTYDSKLDFTKTKITIFDPINKIKFKFKIDTILESPNFLLTKEEYTKYRNKTSHFKFTNFYMFAKSINNIIPKIKSQDKLNREVPSKKETLKYPKQMTNNSKLDKEYIDDAIKYVNKNFKDNYGSTDNFNYPISHKEASRWLTSFIKDKLPNFGQYQDYIDFNENIGYHSCLSSSINLGLINPIEIINLVRPLEKKIKINSLEGYIRQLYWREYQRYCYIYCSFSSKNYFGNSKKLTKDWYTGTTPLKPVNDCIIKAFETGYLHHIERLMIIGNYMTLSCIKPKEGFRWFMEFSIDSYEWVMHQNVYDMVFFVTGGQTMVRPYISSSNYILKMSNYKKDTWSDILDKLYYSFIQKNKKKLWKFRYYFPSLNKN